MIDYTTLQDAELASLLRDGDHRAYTEIYLRFTPVLHAHAYAKLHDRDDAKDVVQELFSALWVKRESLVFHSSLTGYLYTSLRNRILNVIAHKKVESEHLTSLQQFMNKGQAITDHLLRRKQLAELIEKEVANLPPKMQEIFILSRNRQLSHREIAEKLDISEKTVKNQINNALKILRARLGLGVYIILVLFY